MDSTGISVRRTANMFCKNLQALFLRGVNCKTCSQNAEIRGSVVCDFRELLLPCESSLGKGGIVYRQKLVQWINCEANWLRKYRWSGWKRKVCEMNNTTLFGKVASFSQGTSQNSKLANFFFWYMLFLYRKRNKHWVYWVSEKLHRKIIAKLLLSLW